jgi:serine/threonine-protein kinase
MLYYAMPYVVGESLRARLTRDIQLDIDEALAIAGEVAEALSCAHASGIIHRDIKPENILLSGGHAIVADFGIARALDVAGGDRLTETGLALGTPCYMSPEQAAGNRTLDARSDVYALGCVLYEMLAGEPPFTGPTTQSILARHAMDPVPSIRTVRPTVRPQTEAVVARALAKVPADRFKSADEFKHALSLPVAEPTVPVEAPRVVPRHRSQVRAALGLGLAALVALVAARLLPWGSDDRETPSAVRSLAVAPLTNLTGDTSQAYVAEGVTSQLVTSLTQIGALRVVGLKDEHARWPEAELARVFGIDAVLGGSLQLVGDSVRIAVRLRSARTGEGMWAEQFDGTLPTILRLQDEVARAVASRVSVSLTPQEQQRLSSTRPTVNPAAYQAYVRGWHFVEKVSGADFRRAIGYFQQAIDADPTYAPAYVGLAQALEELGYYALEQPTIAYGRARAAGLKALDLDPLLGEAHASVAATEAAFGWDFDAAERGFRRAMELSPKYARGHFSYGMLLTSLGRFDEAIAQMERAQELDPLSLITMAAAARPYYNARRYDDAVAQARRTLDLDSTFSRAHYWLGMAYAQQGKARQALREFQETLRQAGPIPVSRAAAAYAHALAGDRSQARAAVGELEVEAKTRPVSRLEIAAVHSVLGEKERCFEWLEAAFRQRDPLLRFLAVDPRFDPVRSDPRFSALLGRIGFPGYVTSGSTAR